MITIDDEENSSFNPTRQESFNNNESINDRLSWMREFCNYTIRTCTVKYPSSTTEYSQTLLKCTFALDYKANLTIDVPKGSSECSKLKIFVLDELLREELISFTNYLQRQKNVLLAVSMLKKFFILTWERKTILDMLKLHCEAQIDVRFEDCTYITRCTDKRSGLKLFECTWNIHFDYVTTTETDRVDFVINKLDLDFYSTIKIVMKNLVLPKVPFNTKVQQWWLIIQAANASTQLDLTAYRNNLDYFTVSGVPQKNSQELQILESDDEDCIILY